MGKTKKEAGAANPQNTISIAKRPGQMDEEALAGVAYDPLARSLSTGRRYLEPSFGKRGITESFTILRDRAIAVKSGDLTEMERTLVAQIDCLDAIFTEMGRRAAANMSEGFIQAGEVLMRLALKAQAQSRATIETLAAMKAPPAVFARQANVTTGPQQVNNTVTTPAAPNNQCTTRGRAPARAENFEIGDQPHELEPDAEAGAIDARIRSLLGHQQALGLPMQGASGEGVDCLPVPRGEGRGADGKG